MGCDQIHLHRIFRDAVGILWFRLHVFKHRQLPGTVDRNARRKNETLAVMTDRGVDESCTSDEIIRIVKSSDEMAQPLGCVGGDVKYVVEPVFVKQRFYEINICN